MKKIGTFKINSKIRYDIDTKPVRVCSRDCHFLDMLGPHTCALNMGKRTCKFGTSCLLPGENCPVCDKDTASITLFSGEENETD